MSECEYKVGDLVKFESSFFDGGSYANPGIIVAVRDEIEHDLGGPSMKSYSVIWNDGRTSNEWQGYLKKLA